MRVLPSPGITRLLRYYDPLRLPAWPPAHPGVWRRYLHPSRASHVARDTFPACRPHYPGEPDRCGDGSSQPVLPSGIETGRRSPLSLSRPAQGSLALRPAGLLNRPRRPLSRGFNMPGYPNVLLVSYQILLSIIWMEPSSTGICAFVAHRIIRAKGNGLPINNSGIK